MENGWFHRQWLAPVLLFLINVLVARWFNAVQMCRWTRARRSAESLRGAAISCDPGRVTSIETGRAFRRHDEDGSITPNQIGRASCRERVGQDGVIQGCD